MMMILLPFYRDKIKEVWSELFEYIEVFSSALSDKEESGDKKRREIRKSNLLGKPVVQQCLVGAFMRLTGAPSNMSAEVACEKLNRLPWSITEKNISETWDRVFWTGGLEGKLITKNRNLATKIISYLAGEKITDEEKSNLEDEFRKQFTEREQEDKKLPTLHG